MKRSSADCTMVEGELIADLGKGNAIVDLIDLNADQPPLLPPLPEPSVSPVLEFSPEMAPVSTSSPERDSVPMLSPKRVSVPESSQKSAPIPKFSPGSPVTPSTPERDDMGNGSD
ncbi:hypothetical protein Q8A67_006200 [Cirrhinus molitorella]|uniref:Uncharacterized protein n=1 Tax=Cirrhinus molitorella TaxID=172907 RepID=A0AA88Q5R0_9TELE|nr:hypothetical protein Q8A67_006200 [Cirrhinus molitorella]